MFNTIILEIYIFWKCILKLFFKSGWAIYLVSSFCFIFYFLFTALRIFNITIISHVFRKSVYVTECYTTMSFHVVKIKRFLVATKISYDIVLLTIIIWNKSWRIVGLKEDYRGEYHRTKPAVTWYERPLDYKSP